MTCCKPSTARTCTSKPLTRSGHSFWGSQARRSSSGSSAPACGRTAPSTCASDAAPSSPTSATFPTPPLARPLPKRRSTGRLRGSRRARRRPGRRGRRAPALRDPCAPLQATCAAPRPRPRTRRTSTGRTAQCAGWAWCWCRRRTGRSTWRRSRRGARRSGAGGSCAGTRWRRSTASMCAGRRSTTCARSSSGPPAPMSRSGCAARARTRWCTCG
mmetsp:Transcript_32005/g.75414  ORF Transcript_32005/g.75414 Transcript_32005/m.75414 type:complete len:215 (-) Transcript_32005:257-901(-)